MSSSAFAALAEQDVPLDVRFFHKYNRCGSAVMNTTKVLGLGHWSSSGDRSLLGLHC